MTIMKTFGSLACAEKAEKRARKHCQTIMITNFNTECKHPCTQLFVIGDKKSINRVLPMWADTYKEVF